jgi:hypothetical protein
VVEYRECSLVPQRACVRFAIQAAFFAIKYAGAARPRSTFDSVTEAVYTAMIILSRQLIGET